MFAVPCRKSRIKKETGRGTVKLTPGFSVQEQIAPFGKTGTGRILTMVCFLHRQME